MSEKVISELTPRQKREHQEKYADNITLLYFIIQSVILPIIYMNIQTLQGMNINFLVCIIGISYYMLKQIFFSDTSSFDSILETLVCAFLWLMCIAIGSLVVASYTETFNDNQLEKCMYLVIENMVKNIGVLFIVGIISYSQESIKEKAIKLGLTGYKQKIYQIEESNKKFITFLLILVVIFIAVSLLTTQTIYGIDWEKFIIYAGILYGTITLGILVR